MSASSHQEIHLDYEGLIQFEDLESKDKIRTFPQSIRSEYQRQVAEFLQDVKRTLRNASMDYCLLDTSEPLDRALIAYLARRRRRM